MSLTIFEEAHTLISFKEVFRMIIYDKRGNDILNAGETRIAFAVNTEGMNALGFSGMISHQYWPELANIGDCKLGTVMTKRCPPDILCLHFGRLQACSNFGNLLFDSHCSDLYKKT